MRLSKILNASLACIRRQPCQRRVTCGSAVSRHGFGPLTQRLYHARRSLRVKCKYGDPTTIVTELHGLESWMRNFIGEQTVLALSDSAEPQNGAAPLNSKDRTWGAPLPYAYHLSDSPDSCQVLVDVSVSASGVPDVLGWSSECPSLACLRSFPPRIRSASTRLRKARGCSGRRRWTVSITWIASCSSE